MLIIKRVRTAHCKRGPERCETCREMDQERICVLDVDPPDKGMMQRRVIELETDGETRWLEYDVVRYLDTEEEARAYASEHGIHLVDL